MLIDTNDLAGVDWPDQTALPTGQLEQLLEAANQEVTRRAVIANAPAAVDQLNQQVLEAEGRVMGAQWRQPTGAHDAYPKDWEAADEGKMWVSLISGNVWKPGVSGWREKTVPGQTPAWVQPTGAHDAYWRSAEGDVPAPKVAHKAKTWESTVRNNVWEPGVYGWREVTP